MYIKCLSSDRYKLKEIFRFSGDHIYVDRIDSTEFTAVCDESIENMRRSYTVLVIVILISIGSVSVGPIDAFFRKGIKTTPFGTILPFFDENSDTGFYVDMGYQSIVMPFGIVSTICIELCQCMTYNTVRLCADLIALNSDQISKRLETEKKCSVESRAHFRNILMQVQDFDQ